MLHTPVTSAPNAFAICTANVPPDAAVDLAEEPLERYRARFAEAVADDLATPRALATAHEVASASDLTDAERRALLLDFERVLGLDLGPTPPEGAPLPERAAKLLERRAASRAARDFAPSDALAR